MARVTDALLGEKAYARGRPTPTLDLAYGGQMGYAPDLTEWVSNAAHVRRHVFFLLLEAPRVFRVLPDSDKWTQALRLMMEVHPRSIEGLTATLTVDTDNTPVGGGGEIQEEITNVTRAPSTPSFTFNDKYGSPISTFLDNWITYGMMDPNTKVANAGTLSGDRPTDMLPDWYSATGIFIEPDPLHRKVVRSWLCTNMFPKSNGEITGSRDLTSAMQMSNFTVEFAAISQYGLGVNVLAQQLLDKININNANQNLRSAFVTGESADVAAVSNMGYKSSAERVASQAVKA